MKVTSNRTVIEPLMPEHGYCPVEATIELIGGRWKAMILWALINRSPQRFTLLRQAGRGISQKMLAQQLRHLERHGLVTRTVFAEVPPRVEYAITPLGQTLRPVLEAMGRWGTAKRPILSGRSATGEPRAEAGPETKTRTLQKSGHRVRAVDAAQQPVAAAGASRRR